MRRHRRARRFMWVSAGLLFVSLFAVIACTRLEWSRIFPYLMWNHVAVIAMVAYGTFAVRRSSRRSTVRGSVRAGELFSRPILIVALIAAIVAIPNWGAARWDMGQAPDGSTATSHHWHASSDDSRYFESFDRGPDREITQARYEQLNRALYSIFARMWVLLSFLALMIWRFAALSSRDEILNPGNRATKPTVFVGATGLPQWKSTALIAIIWTLVIGGNLVSFAQGRHQAACSISIPPEMQLIVWGMPIAFLCVAALFVKRPPFISPWIASLIDETWGSGYSTDFMARLKPLLLFSVAGLIGSLAIVKGCWQDGQGPVDWTMPGFLLSGSVAFALMHLILRWRRVPGF